MRAIAPLALLLAPASAFFGARPPAEPPCSGHGTHTKSGLCACDPGYTSPDCSVRMCRGGCGGHGLCYDGLCYCEPGWTGEKCTAETHDCSLHGSYDPLSKRCECDSGWSGELCADLDCQCHGHGRCDAHQASCVCDVGFTGSACETRICPAPNGAVCSDIGFCVDGYCRCPPGREGPACEQRSCMGNCSGHGHCRDGSCACDVGWGGPTCATRQCAGLGTWTLNLCSGHGACQTNGTCSCRDGWHGIDCSQRSCPADCHGRGMCREGRCFCNVSFAGDACEHALCPRGGSKGLVCAGHGNCVDGACACHRGWGGSDCSLYGCPVGGCSGHGSCVPIGNGPGYSMPDHRLHFADVVERRSPKLAAYRFSVLPGSSPHMRCLCEEPWTGDDCSERKCTHSCGEPKGRGTCVNGSCWCLPGWRGTYCELRACEGGCGEDHAPSPRGACVQIGSPLPPLPGSPTAAQRVSSALLGLPASGAPPLLQPANASRSTCKCYDGWYGTNCEQPACPKPKPPLLRLPWAAASRDRAGLACGGRGRCDGGSCVCDPAYTGAACERPACPKLCSQHGTCVYDGRGVPKCECDLSYTGADCSERACPNNCSGVGHCSTALDYQCVCPPGRSGPDCSSLSCGADCAAPRGRCIEGACHCAAGWTGAQCERAVCPAACGGHGTCTLKGCACEAGWFGDDCSETHCPDDCFERVGKGKCYRGKCHCSRGFSGANCNSTCGAGIPGGAVCSGHGRCTNGKCECAPGYAGIHCESRSCLMGCSGHGLCRDGTCVCALGYTGPDCATSTAPNAHDCSTGCVHLCTARCATAPARFDGSTTAAAAISSAVSNGDCFSTCRKRCATSCQTHSAQRALWAEGRRKPPNAKLEASAAASRELKLNVPRAAALQPYEWPGTPEHMANLVAHA
jgi:hypothetical protein